MSSRRFLQNAWSASEGGGDEYKFDFNKKEEEILMEFKTDKERRGSVRGLNALHQEIKSWRDKC